MQDRLHLLAELVELRQEMLRTVDEKEDFLANIHPSKQASAQNLLHYLSLRSIDLRPIQERLHKLGLSSLASAETHILSQVEKVIDLLNASLALNHNSESKTSMQSLRYEEGKALLQNHKNRLFGTTTDQKRPAIMVTLPSESIENPKLIKSMLKKGMKVARINCAHDDVEGWETMINHVHKYSHKLGVECKIYMDLAGPKIRSLIPPQPKEKKPGMKIETGDKLKIWEKLKDIPKKEKKSLAISLPNLHQQVKVGQRVYFDDGKFSSVIQKKKEGYFEVWVTKAPSKKNRLKPDKGINLPDTDLDFPALTDFDKACIPFIAKYADMVGYSFVRSSEDIELLQGMLQKEERQPAIILKVERREAVESLPDLLLTAMKMENAGVMIARGDLAVEIGFERLSEIQQEILWICEAAHMPVIWATQVLEQMAKEGLATRAEISDVSNAAKSECVMLNKGKYILNALDLLDAILLRMEDHIDKKRYTFRSLSIARDFFKSSSPDWQIPELKK
jgi:pyruvate kinase